MAWKLTNKVDDENMTTIEKLWLLALWSISTKEVPLKTIQKISYKMR